MTKVKICGLSDPETLTTALHEGADFIGLVFYPPSPRHVDIEVGQYLASFIPKQVEIVGLFVEPDDSYIQQVLNSIPLTMIQLHGTETVARVAQIQEKFKRPVMKALPVSSKDDLSIIQEYEAVADWLLFDAKGEEIPGGNGIPFDWRILQDYHPKKPWMLAGGLTPDNVAQALSLLSPDAVDVSSGVEQEKGVKDKDKIRSFLHAVKKA